MQVTSSRASDTPKTGAAAGSQESAAGMSVMCSLWAQEVLSDQFTQHLSDFHVQESPPTPSARPSPTPAQEMTPTQILCLQDAPPPVCLTAQETTPNIRLQDAPAPAPSTVSEMAPVTQSGTPLPPAPASAPPPATPGLPVPLRSPEVGRARFLSKPFLRVIKPVDREWIAHILYEASGQLKQDVSQNWHHPPNPMRSVAPPNPHDYFRQRMFLWAACGASL